MREGQELGAALQLLAAFRQSACQAEAAIDEDAMGQAIITAPELTLAEERAVNAAADFLEAYFQRGTAAILQPRS
jgi:hypothetical protein